MPRVVRRVTIALCLVLAAALPGQAFEEEQDGRERLFGGGARCDDGPVTQTDNQSGPGRGRFRERLRERFGSADGVPTTPASTATTDGARGERRARIRERLRARFGRADAPAAATTQSAPTQVAARGTGNLTPGDYCFTLQHGGLTRQYLVHVPRSYAGAPTPMILALHGGGGGMRYQANDKNYGLITKSEQAGFIAVFPNGYSRFPSGILATWNAGKCCGKARDENIDDVGFLRAVIETMFAKANVDRAKVFSIGMSNGGLMSYRLACEAPFLIKGIMAVAGTDNTTSCNPARAVPILHVHALNDDRVLFNGGAGKKFRDPNTVTEFVSVPDTIAKWVGLNRASATPQRVLSVPGAYCDLHAAPRIGGAPVKLCVTETGGHSWPGGEKARADEPPSKAIIANDVMWEFFSGL